MTGKSGRTCLFLALPSLALAAAFAIGFSARHSGVTVRAQVATMQLQGSPAPDEGSAAPNADEGVKTARCAQREPHCAALKQEVALALSDRAPRESKAFASATDEIRLKSKE